MRGFVDANQHLILNRLSMIVIGGTILTLAVIPLLSSVKADNINPSVYSTGESPFGVPYQKWLEKFWQWKFAVPSSDSTIHAYSPEKCGIGQQGEVWFLNELLSGKEDRTCTIPAGKAVLIPVLDGDCDRSDPKLQSDQDLIRCASAGNEYGVISASVDGVPIKNLDSYRTHTEFFNLTVPAGNIFSENPPGTYRSYADATALFLHPLSPGSHVVHYTVAINNPIQPSYNYAADLTFHLIAKP